MLSPGSVYDRIAVEYPLTFCDVIGAELSCVIEHPAEQTAVNALQLGRRKLKGFLS